MMAIARLYSYPIDSQWGRWMMRGGEMAIASLALLLLMPVLPTYADTAEPATEAIPGLCMLEDERGGRWVTNEAGDLIPLDILCEATPQSLEREGTPSEFVPKTAAETPNPSPATPFLSLDDQFWQLFLDIASPEAIAFSQQVERLAVVEYGTTICPLLEDGTFMDEIRESQIEGGLPADFDAAVNVAAIHTYCPEFETQIGR